MELANDSADPKAGRRFLASGQAQFCPPSRDVGGGPRFHLGSQGFGGAKGADYGGGVALVGVYFGVEVAHVFGGDFAGQVG
jgi:hypothetical protein